MYDLIILGAGPAGMSAALYGSRAKLNTLVIEKSVEGGQISGTAELENYPGVESISGLEIGMIMKKQAKNFGAQFVSEEIVEVELVGDVKKVKTNKNEYEAKSIIIATGAKPRKIGCQGEEEFTGRGVSYCATCDGAFYEDLDVYVVGGGDAAVEEALFITKFAKKVYVIHRRDELRAAKNIQDQAFANEKIEFIWNSAVEEIKGDKIANEMTIKNLKTGEITTVKGDKEPFGIFVFIGYLPETSLYEGVIDMEKGYIKTDENMKTNVEGVFAAGDLRVKEVRQVVTAASDGAIAAINAEKYIAAKEGTLYEGFKN